MKAKGFLTTFISVCSGTEVFPELIKQPLWRVLWHLLLLAVICGFINVAFRLHPFNKSFEECCANLSKRFGKVEYSEKGIVPSIKPEEARSATTNDFRVDYLPNVSDLKSYTPEQEFDRGIVWTPETVFVWQKYYGEDNWSVFPLLLPVREQKTISELLLLYKEATETDASKTPFAFFSEIFRIPSGEGEGRSATSFREFKTNLLLTIPVSIPFFYSCVLFVYIFLNCLIISPIYILLFSLFSFLFGRSNMLSMKFSQLFIAGIYTGFPGIVIATLYEALALPGMDFQSIFLISYFAYSFAVFGRLNQMKNKPPEGRTL